MLDLIEPWLAPSQQTVPPDWPAAVGKMHWRLEDTRLGILDLSCDTGYVVQAYDLGSPEIREVTLPNSLDDGTFDVTRFHGSRAISLDIVLKPHTGTGPQSPPIGAEAKLRDRLLAYTYPGIRPRLVFCEHDDDRVKQAMIRGAEQSVAVERRNYNKLNVSWVVPRGVYWGWQERCYPFRFDSTTADSKTDIIVNEGSAPAYWRARLEGEAAKPRFILNGTVALELAYESTVGDIIEIESFSRTVSINGKPIGFKYVGDNSTWFRVPPGTSTLTVEQDPYTQEGYPWAIWGPSTEGTFWADHLSPGTPPNNPPPTGRPPWAWTSKIDPGTGLPGFLAVDFCYYDTYI